MLTFSGFLSVLLIKCIQTPTDYLNSKLNSSSQTKLHWHVLEQIKFMLTNYITLICFVVPSNIRSTFPVEKGFSIGT